VKRLVDPMGQLEPQIGKRLRRPARGGLGRRFGDDHATVVVDEWCGTLRRDRRRGEPPSRHQVKGLPQGSTTRVLGPCRHDSYSRPEVEVRYNTLQKLGAADTTVEKDDRGLGP
jgi:hypothetical protein